jgi:hypothetical protein
MKHYWETYSLQTGQSLLNLKGKSLIQMGKFPLQMVKIPKGISFDGCTIISSYDIPDIPALYIYIPIRFSLLFMIFHSCVNLQYDLSRLKASETVVPRPRS